MFLYAVQSALLVMLSNVVLLISVDIAHNLFICMTKSHKATQILVDMCDKIIQIYPKSCKLRLYYYSANIVKIKTLLK